MFSLGLTAPYPCQRHAGATGREGNNVYGGNVGMNGRFDSSAAIAPPGGAGFAPSGGASPADEPPGGTVVAPAMWNPADWRGSGSTLSGEGSG